MSIHTRDAEVVAIVSKDYAHFDISPQTGFLDCANTALELPKSLEEYEWESVLKEASGLRLRGEASGGPSEKAIAWRQRVRNMRVINSLSSSISQSTPLLRRAYVVLCMLGHFYMHSEPDSQDQSISSKVVPAPIATPWLLISSALGVKPALCYASEILWSCTLPAYTTTPAPTDLKVLDTFTNHPSEHAFVLGPARVELEGAIILNEIFATVSTYQTSKDLEAAQTAIVSSLQTIHTTLAKMTAHLKTVMKECDPTHFYFRLRPWIAGTGDVGWTYQRPEGEEDVTMKLGGSTAGASALLQAIDAFLGVQHAASHGQFRRDMQEYMPRGHRNFVRALEKMEVGDVVSSELRAKMKVDDGAMNPMRAFLRDCGRHAEVDKTGMRLRGVYNDVLTAVKAFRDQHFQIVSLFVINQARKAAAKEREKTADGVDGMQGGAMKGETALKGTGGSDLAKLLKGMRDGTVNTMVT